MNALHHIRLQDYDYTLPSDRIAQQPLERREQSKLLVYQQQRISHHTFVELPHLIPKGSLLVFNDTKVIRARLFFRRATGALIEILLLKPESPPEVQQAMQATQSCTWQCIIGRKKRWKEGEKLQLEHEGHRLQAELVDRERNWVRFSWEFPDRTWSQWVEILGRLPLPPYIQREATLADQTQYQTVYADHEGAVAAPTAGLHFTPSVLSALKKHQIEACYLTLHVSAGTFLPVKVDQVVDHDMHAEQFVVSRSQIEQLRKQLGRLIVVGTTSMRVVESLYWLGAQRCVQPDFQGPWKVEKLMPYEFSHPRPSPAAALDALLDWMEQNNQAELRGSTAIFILPGYKFALSQGLITNFHMPETTLMLLVAAFVGEDWRKIYQAALEQDYRFLSYGDSSLLLPE